MCPYISSWEAKKEIIFAHTQVSCSLAGGEPMEPMCSAEDYANVAKRAVSEGYDCVKIDFLTLDRDGRRFSTEETTRLLSPYYADLFEERGRGGKTGGRGES